MLILPCEVPIKDILQYTRPIFVLESTNLRLRLSCDKPLVITIIENTIIKTLDDYKILIEKFKDIGL